MQRSSGAAANRRGRVAGGAIVAYGFLANIGFLGAFVHWIYPPPYPGWATSVTLQSAVAATAALCFWGFSLRFLSRPSGADGSIAGSAGKGVLCGVAATWVALEGAAIAASGYLAWNTFRDCGSQLKILFAAFFVSLLSVQVIAIPALVVSVPFAVIYGAVGGIGVHLVRRPRIS